MFLPSSPLLSSSLASSAGAQSPRYSSQPSLRAPSSFIRSHPLLQFNFLEMEPHLVSQSCPETNPSPSLHQALHCLSDSMLSTTASQHPSIAFYPGQMSGPTDYSVPSYTSSTAPDLQSFMLEENAFRPHDGLSLSPHLAELQLGLINPGFDQFLHCSTSAALHPPDPDLRPQQNQHLQMFSFQPSTNNSTVSSDSIPRASQNPILDYSSGLGLPYPLELQSASIPNLSGFLGCFDTNNSNTNFPRTALASDTETGLLPDESLSEQQIQVNAGRCGADWNSFGSSSPSSADERPSSPGEHGHAPSLFFFSTPPLRRQGVAGEVERGMFGAEPNAPSISGSGGVNPMDLDGYRPEEFFNEALRGPWWGPPSTEEDDRRCSSGPAQRVARSIFGPSQASTGPTRKTRAGTSNRRTGGILLGSEQVPDYSLMPTKRSRGRRPPVSPEVGLPMADGSVAVGAGMQAVPGGQAFDPSLNPASEAVKFCELTKTGKPKKIFVCQVRGCGKCFKRSEHLKRHVRSIHTNHKPYRCPWIACTKSFSRHDNLNQHLRVHRVEEGGEVLNGLHVSSDGVLRSDSGEVRVEPESRGLRNVEVGEGASGFGFS